MGIVKTAAALVLFAAPAPPPAFYDDPRIRLWGKEYLAGEREEVLRSVEEDLSSASPHPLSPRVWCVVREAEGDRDAAAAASAIRDPRIRAAVAPLCEVRRLRTVGRQSEVLSRHPPERASSYELALLAELTEIAVWLERPGDALTYGMAALQQRSDFFDVAMALAGSPVIQDIDARDRIACAIRPRKATCAAPVGMQPGALAGSRAAILLEQALQFPDSNLEVTWLDEAIRRDGNPFASSPPTSESKDALRLVFDPANVAEVIAAAALEIPDAETTLEKLEQDPGARSPEMYRHLPPDVGRLRRATTTFPRSATIHELLVDAYVAAKRTEDALREITAFASIRVPARKDVETLRKIASRRRAEEILAPLRRRFPQDEWLWLGVVIRNGPEPSRPPSRPWTSQRAVAQLAPTAKIEKVAFSDDGSFAALADATGVVWIREVRSGELLARIDVSRTLTAVHTATLALSADASTLAIFGSFLRSDGSAAKRLVLCDVPSMTLRYGAEPSDDGHVTTMVFSPDGEYVALERGTVGVFRVSTGELAWQTSEDATLDGFSSDGRSVAASGRAHSTATGARAPAAIPRRASATKNGMELRVVVGDDVVWTGPAPEYAMTMAVDPRGRTLAVEVERGIRIVDLPSGRLAGILGTRDSSDLGFAGSRTLWSIDGSVVRTWDAWTGDEGAVLGSPRASPGVVTMAPDGRIARRHASSRTLSLWDLSTGVPPSVVSSAATVAFSSEGDAAVGGTDGRVELRHGAEIRWRVPLGTLPVDSVAFRADGAEVIAGSSRDRVFTILDSRTGESRGRFQDGAYRGRRLAAVQTLGAVTATRAVTASEKLVAWDRTDGTPAWSVDPGGLLSGIAIRDDGTLVAATVGSSGTAFISLFDGSTGARRGRLRFTKRPDTIVTTFDEAGRLVIEAAIPPSTRESRTLGGRLVVREIPGEISGGTDVPWTLRAPGATSVGRAIGSPPHGILLESVDGVLRAALVTDTAGSWAVVDPKGRFEGAGPGLAALVGAHVVARPTPGLLASVLARPPPARAPLPAPPVIEGPFGDPRYRRWVDGMTYVADEMPARRTAVLHSIESDLLSNAPHPDAAHAWCELHQDFADLAAAWDASSPALRTALGPLPEILLLENERRLPLALSRFPGSSVKDPWSLAALARIAASTDENEKAFALATRALEIRPQFHPAAAVLETLSSDEEIRARIGRLAAPGGPLEAQRMGRYLAAIASGDPSRELDALEGWADPGALERRARLLAIAGRYREASSALKRAGEIDSFGRDRKFRYLIMSEVDRHHASEWRDEELERVAPASEIGRWKHRWRRIGDLERSPGSRPQVDGYTDFEPRIEDEKYPDDAAVLATIVRMAGMFELRSTEANDAVEAAKLWLAAMPPDPAAPEGAGELFVRAAERRIPGMAVSAVAALEPVAKDPERSTPHLIALLARALLQLGRADEASERCRIALERTPRSIELQLTMVRALKASDRPVEALSRLRATFEWHAPDATAVELFRELLRDDEAALAELAKRYPRDEALLIGTSRTPPGWKPSPVPKPPSQTAAPAELVAQSGHDQKVGALAISPDGTLLATAGEYGSLRLWDLSNGLLVRTTEGERGDVSFAPDGRSLFSGSAIYDLPFLTRRSTMPALRPGTSPRLMVHGDKVCAWDRGGRSVGDCVAQEGTSALSPEGRTLATATDASVRTGDAANGETLGLIHPRGSVLDLAVGSDGTVVVALTTSVQDSVELWKDGRRQWTRPVERARAPGVVAISPDGTSVATGGAGGRVELLDARDGALLGILEGEWGRIAAIAFSPDGRSVFAGGESRGAQRWDVATGARTMRFAGSFRDSPSLTRSPDGGWLAWENGAGGSTWLWDLGAGEVVKQFEHGRTFTFAPDGSGWAIGRWDGVVERWRHGRKNWETRISEEPLESVEFLPDGSVFTRTALLDARDGSLLLRLEGIDGPLVVSSDGSRAVAPTKTGARGWDLSRRTFSWDASPRIPGKTSDVGLELRSGFAMNADGTKVAAGSWVGVVILDGITGTQIGSVIDGTRPFFDDAGILHVVGGTPDAPAKALGVRIDTEALPSIEKPPSIRYRSIPSGAILLDASGRTLCTLSVFSDGTWAVVDPDGRFDAANRGEIHGLHWVVGSSALRLSQLPGRYTPGLLPEAIGLIEAPRRAAPSATTAILLPPAVEIDSEPGSSLLRIWLTDRGAGIGKVEVLVGSLVRIADVRAERRTQTAFAVDVGRFLRAGENVVSVRAWSADGRVSSGEPEVSMSPPRRPTGDSTTSDRGAALGPPERVSPSGVYADTRFVSWARDYVSGRRASALRAVEDDLRSASPHPLAARVWCALRDAGDPPRPLADDVHPEIRRRVGALSDIRRLVSRGRSVAALERFPPSTQFSDPWSASELAAAANELERPRDAARYALAALERWADFYPAVVELALAGREDERVRAETTALIDSWDGSSLAKRWLMDMLANPGSIEVQFRADRKWLRERSGDPDALAHLANSLSERGRKQESIDAYLASDSLDPFGGHAIQAAKILYETGYSTGSIDAMVRTRARVESLVSRSAELDDPERRTLLIARRSVAVYGALWRGPWKYIDGVDEALRRWPEDPVLLSESAEYGLRGIDRFAPNHLPSAHRAVEIDPGDAGARERLVRLKVLAQREASARAELAALLAMPEAATPRIASLVRDIVPEPSARVEMLRTLAARLPTSWTVAQELAAALVAVGENTEAASRLRVSFEHHPPSAEALTLFIRSVGREASETDLAALRVRYPDSELLTLAGKGIPTIHRVERPARGVLPTRDARPRLEIQSLGDPLGMTFSPDGTLIAITSGNTVRLLDVESGLLVRTIEPATDNVGSVAFLKGGELLATDGELVEKEQTISIWRVADGTRQGTLSLPSSTGPSTRYLYGLFSDADGRRLLSVHDGRAAWWDASSLKLLRELPLDAIGYGAVASDGTKFAITDGSSVRIHDASGEFVRTIETGLRVIRSLAVSSGGGIVADGSTADGVNLTEAWSAAGKQWSREEAREPLYGRGIVASAFEYGVGLQDESTGQTRAVLTTDEPVNSPMFAPDGVTVAARGDRAIHFWDIRTGMETHSVAMTPPSAIAAALGPEERALAWIDERAERVDVWDLTSGRPAHSLSGSRMWFGQRDEDWLIAAKDGLTLWSEGKPLWSRPECEGTRDAWIGTSAIAAVCGGEVLLFEPKTGGIRGRFEDRSRIDAAVIAADGSVLAISDDGVERHDTAGAFEWQIPIGHPADLSLDRAGKWAVIRSRERLVLLDARTGAVGMRSATRGLAARFDGGTLRIRALASLPIGDQQRLVALGVPFEVDVVAPDAPGRKVLAMQGRTDVRAGIEGTLAIFRSGKPVATLASFPSGAWAVIDAEGRYDAANGGDIDELHWVVGNEPLLLTQLKDRYYDPGLLAKRMGLSREPLRDVESFGNVALFPSLSVTPPTEGNTRVTVALQNRGGGIGRVQVFVNDKEVVTDARAPGADPKAAKATLSVDLANAPVIPGEPNEIRVVAYDAEGRLASRGAVALWKPRDVPRPPPELYAVVIGISSYSSPQLALRFAAKDAEDFASALEVAAGGLLGKEHVHVTRVIDPTKKAVREAFESARKAKPWDLFVVYLAGHGVAVSGKDATYCYLTKEARGMDEMADPAVRGATSVTSEELTTWINRVPALKQVMILDTCAAGAAAAKLMEKRALPGNQILAIERLKDRTGFHVLMGSAADAVSYEATRYGQGLLTYSLLEAMKGARLREGNLVDVSTLFQYAADRVPELARDIGGVQRPIIAAPGGTSFPIGLLDAADRERIPIARVKPFVLRPFLIDPQARRDVLGITSALKAALRQPTKDYVFVDASEDELRDAILPSGTYSVTDGNVEISIGLFRDGAPVGNFEVTGKADDLPALVAKLKAEIVRALPSQ